LINAAKLRQKQKKTSNQKKKEQLSRAGMQRCEKHRILVFFLFEDSCNAQLNH
jgi:hypothetical protein